MIVPLDFRDVILGRLRPGGVRGASSWIEEEEDEADDAELGISTAAGAVCSLGYSAGFSVAILCWTASSEAALAEPDRRNGVPFFVCSRCYVSVFVDNLESWMGERICERGGSALVSFSCIDSARRVQCSCSVCRKLVADRDLVWMLRVL